MRLMKVSVKEITTHVTTGAKESSGGSIVGELESPRWATARD